MFIDPVLVVLASLLVLERYPPPDSGGCLETSASFFTGVIPNGDLNPAAPAWDKLSFLARAARPSPFALIISSSTLALLVSSFKLPSGAVAILAVAESVPDDVAAATGRLSPPGAPPLEAGLLAGASGTGTRRRGVGLSPPELLDESPDPRAAVLMVKSLPRFSACSFARCPLPDARNLAPLLGPITRLRSNPSIELGRFMMRVPPEEVASAPSRFEVGRRCSRWSEEVERRMVVGDMSKIARRDSVVVEGGREEESFGGGREDPGDVVLWSATDDAESDLHVEKDAVEARVWEVRSMTEWYAPDRGDDEPRVDSAQRGTTDAAVARRERTEGG